MWLLITWRASLLALMLVLAGFISYRLGLIEHRTAIALMALGLLIGFFAGIIATARILKLKARSKKVEPNMLLAVIVGLFPALMVIGAVGTSGFGKPLIHDISTDTENPPSYVLAAMERNSLENPIEYEGAEVARQQRVYYPEIKTLDLQVPVEKVEAAVQEFVVLLGWRLLDGKEGLGREGYIEAVVTTQVMGFADDVVFRLEIIEGGTRVDIRSSSRIGEGDLGTNAKRVEMALNYLRMRFSEYQFEKQN